MDALGIGFRAVFVFLVLLVMVRLQGKHSIRQGTPFDFVLALIVGDLVDDVIFGEIALGMFLAAAGTLFAARMLTALLEWRVGSRVARS